MKKYHKIIIFFISILFLLMFLINAAGVFINSSTNSIQKGIYIKDKGGVSNGKYIAFCLNKKNAELAYKRNYISGGFCAGGYEKLFKKIIASFGDVVIINKQGIFINGVYIENSIPLVKDGGGVSIAHANINNVKLGDNQFVVFGDTNKYSYDSRYFGIIEKEQIISPIKLVYPFNNGD